MSFVFSQFSFRALWSPYYLLGILCVIMIYLMCITIWRRKFQGSSRVSGGKVSFFLVGMIFLYAVKGGPVDLFSHLMFTGHMVQMAILYLVIPPFLLLGMPSWLMKAIISKRIIKNLVEASSKPLIALLLFNAMFSFYHLPIVFDYIKSNEIVHAIFTTVLFFFAIMMWWPIFTPIIEYHTLSHLKKIGYIFANGIVITPACALIIFADTAMYTTYTDPKNWLNALTLCVPLSEISSLQLTGPEMFNLLPPLDDQRLGGTIMKILQEIIYGIVLGYIFAGWMKKERKNDEFELNELLSPRT